MGAIGQFRIAKPLGNTVTAVGNGNLWYTVSQDLTSNRHTVRWETYTSFNMPQQILFGALVNTQTPANTVVDRKLTFVYGPEHQRIRQTVQLTSSAPSAMQAGTTWYLNGEDSQGLTYEKEVKENGITEHKHYLSAGGMVFAMQVSRTGAVDNNNPLKAASTLTYFHHDHLGSIAAISNEAGTVVERLAFDPWGKRRGANGLPDPNDSLAGSYTDRGFTMHEHLDEMGAIHMNGRIYDPLIGRFMSADPFIQAPDDLQSYNRYAYVMNNPLNLTDPSGYWSFKSLFKIAVVAAVGFYAPQFLATYGFAGATAATATLVNAAATGFLIGAATSGTFKGGVQGAFTASLFSWAGTIAPEGVNAASRVAAESIERYAAHALAGCVSSVASGGGCGQGAASRVFGKFASNSTHDWGIGVAQGAAAAVAGGVGSVIAGGKFENGATTAAFGYLFNQVMSRIAQAEALQRGTCTTPSVACSQQNAAFRAAYDSKIESQAIESLVPDTLLLAAPVGRVGSTAFTILEREGSLIIGSFQGVKGEAQIITNVVWDGSTLYLKGTHIQGEATLREALNVAATYGREQGASRVVIEGGVRTTGARIGHTPRPLVIDIK